jgi:MEMO1 family protein
MKIRRAVVAGHFYPKDRDSILSMMSTFIKRDPHISNNTIAAVVPHAGYIYSGATAGKVYSLISIPSTVVVLCPNHTGLGSPISIHPAEVWETPLGTINIDNEFIKRLQPAVPQAEMDGGAQYREHALEVQLPFLQAIREDFKLVPITISHIDQDSIKILGTAIGQILFDYEKEGMERPLIIASSDMTHFEDDKTAKTKDDLAIDRIKALDSEGLLRVVQQNSISMCGIFPASVMIEAVKHYSTLKNSVELKVELIDYTNSGMVTRDFTEVVAYAGIMVSTK